MYKQKKYLYYFSHKSEIRTFNIAFVSPYDEDHFNPILSKSHTLTHSYTHI